jgi:hypothetical protein
VEGGIIYPARLFDEVGDVNVVSPDGVNYEAEIEYLDHEADLCILRVNELKSLPGIIESNTKLSNMQQAIIQGYSAQYKTVDERPSPVHLLGTIHPSDTDNWFYFSPINPFQDSSSYIGLSGAPVIIEGNKILGIVASVEQDGRLLRAISSKEIKNSITKASSRRAKGARG